MAALYPILIHSQSIPYLNTLQSAANQIRVLRNTSRQQIRIEYYVTRELSARVEVPSRLSARVGSLLPILIHRDLHPPSALLNTLLLVIFFNFFLTLSFFKLVTASFSVKLFYIILVKYVLCKSVVYL